MQQCIWPLGYLGWKFWQSSRTSPFWSPAVQQLVVQLVVPPVWVLQWCRHSFPMFSVCSRSIVADSRCPAKPRHVETCPEDMQRHALKARLQQQDIIIYIIRMFTAFTRHVYSEIFNDSECLFCSDSARILLGFCSACFGRLSLLLIHCGPGKVCKGFFVLWRLNLPSLLGVGYLALASMSAELEP
jgi:hypothetical protein